MTFSSLLNRQSLPLLAAFYIFFATIPLVWVRLLGTSIAPYHVAAVGVMVMVALTSGATAALSRSFATGRVIWLAILGLIIAMAISYTRSVTIFQPFFFAKFVGFSVAALVSAALVLLIIRRGLFPALALVPAVASGVFVAFISIQFAAANINPGEVIGLAIARADPNIVMNQLFRAAFAASNEDISYRSNLKQSLSFAFVLMIPLGFLASQYIAKRRVLTRLVVFSGLVFCVLMSIAPFSRAAWLALFLIGICLAFSYIRSPRGMMAFIAALILGIPAIFIIGSGSDLFALIEARLSSTDSVDARLYAVEEHWEAIGNSPFLGRDELVDGWAHNIIIDSWSAFGLLGMAAALLFFLGSALMVGKALALSLTASPANRRVHAAIAAFLCPALVRTFTAPNVTVDFPVWIGIGLAIGLAADAWLSARENSFRTPDVAVPSAVPAAA